MKTTFASVLGLGLMCVAIGADAGKDELQAIFNGKDLTGWKVPAENPWWKVVEGVLVGENDEKLKGNVLYTEKSYTDVIFETDVRWSGEIDSGIYLRKAKAPAKGEVQVQIGVSRSLKKDMTCSLYIHGKYPDYAQAKNTEKLLKANDWNTMRVQAIGAKYTLWLNVEMVMECEDPAFPNAGPIGVQIHGGLKMKVEFRNMKVKDLGEGADKK